MLFSDDLPLGLDRLDTVLAVCSDLFIRGNIQLERDNSFGI